jgi:lipopolysaccharide transport system ATP-binding protein
MTEVILGDGEEESLSGVRMGSKLTVSVAFDTRDVPLSPILGVVIKNSVGSPLFGVNNRIIPGYEFEKRPYDGRITCELDRLPLMPGLYWIDLHLGDGQGDRDVIYDAISFEVTSADVFGSGKLPPPTAGPFCWPASWKVGPSASSRE